MGDMDAPDRNWAEAEVLRRARAGDIDAIATLYVDHAIAARRLATILSGADDADDLVSDAFTRVLARLSAGHGPDDNFRGYLFAAIRNRHRDLRRRGRREEPASDRPQVLDDTAPAADARIDERDHIAAAAFRSLPERWRQILWALEVESRSITDVAADLGLSPTALTSLASRAREGMRVAYLQQQVVHGEVELECQWVIERLGRFVRGQLGDRGRTRIGDHLRDCSRCTPVADRLTGLNQRFDGAIAVRDAS